MAIWNKKKLSPQEKLRRKVRKKVRNQGQFLKHSIVYLILLACFLTAAIIIRDEDFVIPFFILFSCWLVGLIFHGLSAFVFHRIDSWEETRYQQKLMDLHLRKEHEVDPLEGLDEGEIKDVMDLKSYERLRKELDEKWGEGDFV